MNDSTKGLNIRFLDTDIEYSASQCLYYKTHHQFQLYAEKVAKEYEKVYKAYQNYQTFSEKGIEDGTKLAERYIGQGMQILLDAGIYTVSRAEFENQCSWEIYQCWNEVVKLNYELDKAAGITVKEAEALREARKASRSRPISVGFGVRGSVESYAVSGGINAISGLLHSGANAIGNARTRSAVREKLNEIYQSPDLLDAVKECAYHGTMAIWGVVQFHLHLEDSEWKGLTIPEEDRRRAGAYCENFVHIPDDKRDGIAVEILKYGVADIKTYEVLVQAYQDRDGVLMQAACAFGLEKEYRAILREKISDTLRPDLAKYIGFLTKVTLEKLPKVTEDIYAEIRYTLTEICKQYHIDADDPVFSACWEEMASVIGRRVDGMYDADKKARTFNGILFPTVETAALAKNIEGRVLEIDRDFEGKPSAEQSQLLLEIEQLNSQAPEQLKASIEQTHEKLKGIYESTEQEERTFLDTLFPTREDKLAAEEQYRSLMAQWFSDPNAVTPDSMKAARESLENQKDLVEPVRQAILKRITAQENKLAQDLRQQQEEKNRQSRQSKLIAWNLLYGVLALWALLFWKLFRFDGVESSTIGLFQLFFNNTDTITAARGFLAVGVVVLVVQTLSAMKKALKRDLKDVLSHPGVVFGVGLFAWVVTAFFHLSYDIATDYIVLLVVSLFFQMAQWFSDPNAVTPDSMKAARESLENQKDLVEPVRQAILKRITAQENKLAQDLRQQQEEKNRQSRQSKLIAWNLLYGVLALWALLFWKLFRFDGVESSTIGLFQLFFNNTDTITAARGFLAVGVVVLVVQTLSAMKKALKRDLKDVLSHPGVVFGVGLFAWVVTAFFHLSYDIATDYIVLLVVSLFFQMINSSKGKGILKKLGIFIFCCILLGIGVAFFGQEESAPVSDNSVSDTEDVSQPSTPPEQTEPYLSGEYYANDILSNLPADLYVSDLKIGVLYIGEEPVELIEGFADTVAEFGLQIEDKQSYVDGTSDFTVQLYRFQTAGVNFIFLLTPDMYKSPEIGTLLLVQADDVGFYPYVYDPLWGYVDPVQEDPSVSTLNDFGAIEGTYHMADDYTLQMGLWFESDMTGVNSSNWQSSEPLELHFQLNNANEILGDGVAYWWPLSEGQPLFEGELYSSLDPITIGYDGYNFVVSCSALGLDGASFFKE